MRGMSTSRLSVRTGVHAWLGAHEQLCVEGKVRLAGDSELLVGVESSTDV